MFVFLVVLSTYARIHGRIQGRGDLPWYFLLKVLWLQFLRCVIDPFKLPSAYGVKPSITPFFHMWPSRHPSTICSRVHPWWGMVSLWQNKLAIGTQVYVRTFKSVSLFSVLMLSPHCFDHCSFAVSSKLSKCELSTLVLLLWTVILVLSVTFGSLFGPHHLAW